MIMIIWGHHGAAPYWVYSLMNPVWLGVFFIISGYFFSNNDIIHKNIKRLLIPWGIFTSIGFMYQISTSLIDNKIAELNWLMIITDLKDSSDFQANIPLWFLISLFEITLLYHMLRKIQNFKLLTLIICILSYTGHYLITNNLSLPLYINKVFLYLFYFHIGYSIKRNNKKVPILYKVNNILLSVGIIAFITYRYYLQEALFQSSTLISYCTDTILTIAITYNIYCYLIHYRHNSFISYIGANSLVVLCTHILLLNFIWRVSWGIFGEPHLVLSIIHVAIILLFSAPIIYIYNTYINPLIK